MAAAACLVATFVEVTMAKKRLTAGQGMIASAKQALALAKGKTEAGVAHIPEKTTDE